MINATGIYKDEFTGNWNLVINGEWIWEGTYEQCERMYYDCIDEEVNENA